MFSDLPAPVLHPLILPWTVYWQFDNFIAETKSEGWDILSENIKMKTKTPLNLQEYLLILSPGTWNNCFPSFAWFECQPQCVVMGCSESIAHEAHSGSRNNCFSIIQLVGQKYPDKTTLASKTRFNCHCFGFLRRRFSLLVGYNCGL